jgi:hypothetical protein
MSQLWVCDSIQLVNALHKLQGRCITIQPIEAMLMQAAQCLRGCSCMMPMPARKHKAKSVDGDHEARRQSAGAITTQYHFEGRWAWWELSFQGKGR